MSSPVMYETKCPLISFEKDQPFAVAERFTKAVCVVLLGRNLLHVLNEPFGFPYKSWLEGKLQ
jgi:hypothetical protein